MITVRTTIIRTLCVQLRILTIVETLTHAMMAVGLRPTIELAVP